MAHISVPERTEQAAQLSGVERALLAAGTFGVLPLFAPELGRLVHLHINAPFIARQAGSASLGYAVMTLFAQRALSSQELRLPIIMAAIFNGVSGIVSIPAIFNSDVIVLPLLIAPVGLAVLVGTLIGLRRAWPQAAPRRDALISAS
jgi:Na+/H+ antiporter NhaA